MLIFINPQGGGAAGNHRFKMRPSPRQNGCIAKGLKLTELRFDCTTTTI